MPSTAPAFADSRSGPREEANADREPWIYLGIGALTAPIFALTPLLGYMGWFLASLVHEMGHAGFAWLCGMPAFPVISLAGHAAAVHEEQQVGLAWMIAAALCVGAWRVLNGAFRIGVLVAIAVIYPLIAFTEAREVLHLVAGHAGELAFATLALWKTLDGGFTRSSAERALYSTVGWFLLGKNVILCWSLMQSESARIEYMGSGSFGFPNDPPRLAGDLLGWRRESVAPVRFAVSLTVVPPALTAWRVSTRARSAEF